MKVKADPEVRGIIEVVAHPLPSGATPKLGGVIIPVLEMLKVGVLVPSRFTLNAARLEVPDPQLATKVAVPAVAVLTLRVAQFAFVAKVTGGTVTAGNT